MILKQLLEGLDYSIVQGNDDILVSTLEFDSRKEMLQDSVFVCMIGVNSDGHDFVNDVEKKGAAAVIVSKEVTCESAELTIIKVDDTRKALAFMSAAYFSHPAKELVTVGITGTKGKTTTTYMVRSILEKSGIKTGLIGTIEIITGNRTIPAKNTTPESYYVQKYFREMADCGCKCVVMEVSSQALMLHRVSGFMFDYGIFTNLSPDHVGPGEHEDFNHYAACKALLFQNCRVGIMNADDSHLDMILKGHTCQVETYGIGKADLRAEEIDYHTRTGSLSVSYHVRGLMDFLVQVDIPGKFSVYNSLTAIAICRHFNVPVEVIKEALLGVTVRGRVEPVCVSSKFTVMIDYAHNAMSLESVLETIKEYHPKRLVCLFGCGGNRARDRRFEMGEISSKMADLTIVTSDNPRFEEPEAIIADIVTGVKKADGEYVAITDRKEAIRYAIEHAKAGDVILIAGKGHEDYQEICGVKHHMDDRELIYEVVENLTKEQRTLLL